MNSEVGTSDKDEVVLVASSDSEAENDSEISYRVSSPPTGRGRKRRLDPSNQGNVAHIENKLISSILEINTNIAKMVHVQAEIVSTFKSFVDKMDTFISYIGDKSKDGKQMNGLGTPVSEDPVVRPKARRVASSRDAAEPPAGESEGTVAREKARRVASSRDAAGESEGKADSEEQSKNTQTRKQSHLAQSTQDKGRAKPRRSVSKEESIRTTRATKLPEKMTFRKRNI